MTFTRILLLAVACLVTAKADYLFLYSNPDNVAFRSSVSTILGSPVAYVNAGSTTPSLAQLQAYQGVFTWVNTALNDPTGLGDTLADYADQGGRVVLGAFATFTQGYALGGRIMTAGYLPVTSPSGDNYVASAAYAGDGTGALWNGVGSYNAKYRDKVVLQGGGVLNGTFVDGSIAGAVNTAGNVVYLGGMASTGTSGDAARLLANALREPLTSNVPEPSSILVLSSAELVAIGVSRRRRR